MIDIIYLLLILDTWRKDVKYGEIKEAIYEAATGDYICRSHVNFILILQPNGGDICIFSL
jgi:hypothetical protein